MTVGVFGRALAALLRELPGRVYVELPTTLRQEADSLASSLNTSGGKGSCLVFVEEPTAVDPGWVVPAQDLLAWRTSEDRTFVLVGGAVEPDSSFATSAVPFMTSAFPGVRGGTCGPATLARATVGEAFSGNELDPDAAAGFEGAAPWVFDLLARSLQGSPSPTQGWQERLLVRWARLVAELEDAVAVARSEGRRITAWDAWELVRLAGFPRPSFGTMPSDPPPHADEVRDAWLDRVASDWRVFFEDHVRTAGVATVLDRLAAASAIPGTRRWGCYDWERAAREAQRFAAAPSDLGRQLFSRSGFGPREGPVSPNDWRAVQAEEIGRALEATGSEPVLSALEGFLSKGDGFPPMLDTRGGAGLHQPSGRSDKVPVKGLSVLAKEIGSRLALAGEADGETGCVIEEVSVQVVPKTGLSVRPEPTLSVAGSALRIEFGMVMDVRTRADGPVRWSPSRRLKVTVFVRDVVGGVRQPRRAIEMYLGIVVPSPYWPTVLAVDRGGEVVVSPASDVQFDSGADGAGRTPTESPELLVSREANAVVLAFDGRWDGKARAFRGPSPFAYPQVFSDGSGDAGYDFDANVRLFDDAVLTAGSGPDAVEATVVRVLGSEPLPTNPLGRSSVDEPLGEPSRASRDAPLGRYQTAVAAALVEALAGSEAGPQQGGSLFQLVVSSTTGEIPRSLAFGTKPTATSGATGPWPGLGDGPSVDLRSSPAWDTFVDEARKVAGAGLDGGVADWLSAIDAVAVGPPLVRRYLKAHRDLIDAARTPTDLFWARHPFSVFLVDGSRGPEWGTLKAVFLSPMHPIRVGWLLGAQLHARALPPDSDLAGMVDGWNFPAAGVAPGPGGSTSKLVAMPLDPGADGDMAAWGALVPTSANGIVRPPLSGAGARLPWGGRTGLNEKVVRQSLEDYRVAHPYLNSLQIELRSAIEAPRSAEVDRAVLEWAGDAGRDIGGVIRVLDSDRRLGEMPSRDALSSWSTGTGRGRFSWVVRGADEELPAPVDLAFVENAAPFTFVVEGQAMAPVAPLPIRRFPTATGAGDEVDYLYAGGGRDIIGLEDLLSVFEPPSLALRVVTTGRALDAEREVRWEVVGDINMEPSQMARLAQSTDDRRQLWEWQPGLLAGRRGKGATRGARYVLAKAPRSLVAGLRRNLGLDATQADDLLRELGGRGIGLATLRRPGTTQEAEAAGLFYAARLLTGFQGCTLPPGWLPDGWHLGLMPLDPMRGMVASMGNGRPEESRADLCLVLLGEEHGTVRLKLVPVECKHRGSATSVASPPSAKDRRGAVEQAAASSARLREFQDGLHVSTAGNAVDAAGRLQALATLVELALKFGPNEPPPEARARAVQEILRGRAELEVGPGMVVWSLSGESGAGEHHIVAQDGGDGVLELVIRPKSLAPFLWADGEASSSERELRADLDGLLRDRLAFSAGGVLREGLEEQLLSALGLDGHLDAMDEAANSRTPAAGSDAGDGSRPTERMRPGGELVPSRVEVGEEGPPSRPSPPSEVEGREGDGGDVAGRDSTPPSPAAFVGSEASTRYTLVGEMSSSGQLVALDLDQPKAIGVFGYMGSGKSYLLGAIIEGASANLPGLNVLRSPLAVVVFNYRRNAADRFELASLTRPNDETADVERLYAAYGAEPSALEDVHVLCLPGELRGRRAEYSGATASELRFKPSSLDVEEWELLMGEPGSDAVFARTIRTSLRELRREGSITLDGLRDHLSQRLQKGSLSAAELRLEAADRMLSEDHGTDFADVIRAGRVLVVDLRQPMFNRDDAMKLMLVCASQIAKQRTSFNKLVVFDEAHEYMTEAFGERFDARIRYMRHEGSSYVFATQDVASVPTGIRRHLGTNFVFSLQTRDNIADMVRLAPEFASVPLQHVEPGSCYVTSSASTGDFFAAPRLVKVRPRATAHGGKSRIFDD